MHEEKVGKKRLNVKMPLLFVKLHSLTMPPEKTYQEILALTVIFLDKYVFLIYLDGSTCRNSIIRVWLRW